MRDFESFDQAIVVKTADTHVKVEFDVRKDTNHLAEELDMMHTQYAQKQGFKYYQPYASTENMRNDLSDRNLAL